MSQKEIMKIWECLILVLLKKIWKQRSLCVDFVDILKLFVWSNDLDIDLTWWKTPKVDVLHVAISFVSHVTTTNLGLKTKTAYLLSYFESPRHTSICLPMMCRRNKSYLITIVFGKCFIPWTGLSFKMSVSTVTPVSAI